jgi:transposase-like protein
MKKKTNARKARPSTLRSAIPASTEKRTVANETVRRTTPAHPRPRVINVDGNPSYPKVIAELKQTGNLGRRCRCRPVRYLNNIVEQDHRAVKRRVRAMQGFRAFQTAWRTIQGIETLSMIRKGQVKWLAKDDIPGQAAFVGHLFGLTHAA